MKIHSNIAYNPIYMYTEIHNPFDESFILARLTYKSENFDLSSFYIINSLAYPIKCLRMY
jgi:hypothetical protein